MRSGLAGWINIGALLLLLLASCRTDKPLSPRQGYADRRERTVLDGETECPPEVSPADCIPLTSAERDDLINELQAGINWNDASCWTVGNQLIDFVNTGDVRKFNDFDNMVTMGSWTVHNGQEEIAWNRNLMTLGWSSTRLGTSIHEGYHSVYRGPGSAQDEQNAENFANWCINW